MARGQSEYERWMRQQQREEERRQRAAAAAERAAERERRQQQIAAGHEHADRLTRQLEERVAELESILRRGLQRSAQLDVRSLARRDPPPELDLGERARPVQPPDWEDFQPAAPSVLGGLLGGRARHARRLAEAEEAFARACRERDTAENRRQAWVREQRAAHAPKVAAYEAAQQRQAADLADWDRGRTARERESVERYLTAVAERIPLPRGLPRSAEIAYSPRGEQAVARVELPGTDAVQRHS